MIATLTLNQRNPLRLDPTRTTMLRRAFENDIRRRLQKVRQLIRDLIVAEDAFGLKPRKPFSPLGNRLVVNIRWAFITNPEKLRAFQQWFKEQVDSGLLDIEPGAADPVEPWTAKHTGSAYKRGVRDAFIKSKGKALDVESDFFEGTQSQFLQSAFGGKIGTAQIEMLGLRSFEKLRGITGEMSGEMSRILSGGLAEGLGARVIARQMTNSIAGIERRRAMTIARTEIIHAYAEGQLDSFDALGIEEVGILSEWSTVGDDRVCPLCLPMEGVIFKVKEARGMIPRHVSCRCSWLPVIPSKVSARVDREGREALKREGRTRQLTKAEIEKTKPPKTSKTQIEDAIRKSVRAEHPKASKEEAFKRSRSRIADVKISKSRIPIEKVIREVIIVPTPPGEVELPFRPIKSKEGPKPKTLLDRNKLSAKATRIRYRSASNFSEQRALKPAQAITEEIEGMAKRLPKVADFIRQDKIEELTLLKGTSFKSRTGSNAMGQYDSKQRVMRIAGELSSRGSESPKLGKFNVGIDLQSTFRHEYGHRYWSNGLSDSNRGQWNRLSGQYLRKIDGKWPVSEYGTTDPDELFAESFSAYAHKNYVRGSLPKDIEVYMDVFVKGGT